MTGIMPLRPCLESGCPEFTTSTRCDLHRLERERRRDRSHRRRPRARWREQQAAIDRYVAEVGLWCPGWRDRPAHPVSDRSELTFDHLEPLALGGDVRGDGMVRCKPCNSARGARPP